VNGGGGTVSPTQPTILAGQSYVDFTITWATTGSKTVTFSTSTPTVATYTNNVGTVTVTSVAPAVTSFDSTLSVRSGSTTGALPYVATVLPLRGEVPAGYTVVSGTDSSMRASILSTYDDGSAAVVVVSGTATVPTADANTTIALTRGPDPGGTNLTTSAIAAAVTSVAVNFSGTYGNTSLTSFGSPSTTWWANPTSICASYRLAAPTPGTTGLEAVIYITAFVGGRALVEVVIENGKMSSSSPAKPTAATYTGATVSVNGSTIATVNSTGPASAEGNHAAFRAWYARVWVGGDQLLSALTAVSVKFRVENRGEGLDGNVQRASCDLRSVEVGHALLLRCQLLAKSDQLEDRLLPDGGVGARKQIRQIRQIRRGFTRHLLGTSRFPLSRSWNPSPPLSSNAVEG
jgi:hypothetical protein